MTMHVGQSELSALVFFGQTFVIDPQQVQQRGVEVMNMNAIVDDVVAVGAGFAISCSGFDPAASHVQTEATRVVIATKVLSR